MIFLIRYDTQGGRSVSIERFEDEQRATAQDARLALELDLRHRSIPHEVVLLDAIDETSLRRTHARYFESLDEMMLRMERGLGEFVVRETKD